MSVQRSRRSRLGRIGLRALAVEAGLVSDRQYRRGPYMTRTRRMGLVRMAAGLERVGKSAQAAGLRDKVVDLEQESLRRRVARVNRTEKRKV